MGAEREAISPTLPDRAATLRDPVTFTYKANLLVFNIQYSISFFDHENTIKQKQGFNFVS